MRSQSPDFEQKGNNGKREKGLGADRLAFNYARLGFHGCLGIVASPLCFEPLALVDSFGHVAMEHSDSF